MPRVRLTLEYDGAEFVGWQVQPNGRSVQQELERALGELLGEDISVVCAGRTDSGVHALGQVAAFSTRRELPLKAYHQGLNGILPSDIAVRAADHVRDDFDPRRWALAKRYRYALSNLPGRSPLRRRTHWEIFQRLDVNAMRLGAHSLCGRHDFSAFRAADCQARHALRLVHEISVNEGPDGEVRIEIEGTAFLKHMVRNVCGTLVDVGRGKHPPAWVAEVLHSRDRTRAGPTAPPHGLCLLAVRYSPDGGPRTAAEPQPEDDDE